MTNFEPIELENPNTGEIVRLARSYDTMLYDTVRTGFTTLAAGNVATFFAGNLNGFVAKGGSDVDNLIVSSKLPTGSIALVHKICFDIDVTRPTSVAGALETYAADILAIRRECFADLNLNGQTLRRLGRLQFYPPWFSAHMNLGAQAAGGHVALDGEAVDFQGPVILGAWGSSQIQMPVTCDRAIAFESTSETYEITVVAHVTMLNPISEGDGGGSF